MSDIPEDEVRPTHEEMLRAFGLFGEESRERREAMDRLRFGRFPTPERPERATPQVEDLIALTINDHQFSQYGKCACGASVESAPAYLPWSGRVRPRPDPAAIARHLAQVVAFRLVRAGVLDINAVPRQARSETDD